jgi:SAM-dependent methyltransferase
VSNYRQYRAGSCTFHFIFRFLIQKKFLNVFAVEPNHEMKRVFIENLPDVPIKDGLANKIPFGDGFFQIVFVAQAFHWFANIETLREIHRVIKPQSECKHGSKSGFVFIWNIEDADEEPYIKEIRNEWDVYSASIPQYYKNQWKRVFTDQQDEISRDFTDLQTKFYKHAGIHLSLSFIWKRIISISFISALSAEEQEKLRSKVWAIFKKHKNSQKLIDNEVCLHYPHYTELVWSFKK